MISTETAKAKLERLLASAKQSRKQAKKTPPPTTRKEELRTAITHSSSCPVS